MVITFSVVITFSGDTIVSRVHAFRFVRLNVPFAGCELCMQVCELCVFRFWRVCILIASCFARCEVYIPSVF